VKQCDIEGDVLFEADKGNTSLVTAEDWADHSKHVISIERNIGKRIYRWKIPSMK
jgi:hypothetical protein